jgi:voltage-gated potassium channel
VTASLASWFVENLRRSGAAVERELDEVSADVNRTEVQLAAVLVELRALNARLDALEPNSKPS